MQNLVALLTYDDSVKRLIFGKKLQNHDVITGEIVTWYIGILAFIIKNLFKKFQSPLGSIKLKLESLVGKKKIPIDYVENLAVKTC